MSVIDFFCGIGGFANSLPRGTACLAIDINRQALEICRRNTGAAVACRTIESLREPDLEAFHAGSAVWWMSPPCQPHTQRGRQGDLRDPRSAGLLNLIRLLGIFQPPAAGLENVPSFEGSESHRLLEATLAGSGYRIRTLRLCPTQFGGPNRRPRFFLLASRSELPQWEPIEAAAGRLELETGISRDEFAVDRETLTRYGRAMHIVRAGDFLNGTAVTRCFTSAYGRSPLAAGSCLDDGWCVRRFTPREILWQLGFPRDFELPALPGRRLWPLVGNTLSRPCVDYVNRHLLAAVAGA